jgi:hypothetical protein
MLATKFYNKKVPGVYYLPNTIWVIKSRMMGLVEYVAHIREKRNAYRVLVGKTDEDHL